MAARRSYTKEQREAVLADVPTLGVSAAAKKHGVPQTTLTNWGKAAGVQRAVAPSASSASRAKARARKSKEGARPRRRLEEPVEATGQPPARRTLKVRVAKIYTPSQKGEILEHAATHGITEASKKF